jgi:hypothetical protein
VFFKADGTVATEKLNAALNPEQRQRFNDTCFRYPTPFCVPSLDTPYPTKFGREFGEDCPCFEWEIRDGD